MNKVELKDLRTLNTKSYLNEDKSITIEMYKENVHYLKDGKYEEIDNTLVKTDNGFKNKSNDFEVEFDEVNKQIKVEKNNNKLLMSLKNKYDLKDNYKLSKVDTLRKVDDIKYKLDNENVNVSYEVHPNELKETILINDKIDVNSFVFSINTDLELKLNEDNTISAFEQNKEIYKIAKPYMVDSKSVVSENVIYDLEKDDKEYTLTIRIDKEWVNSDERVYPIFVDPTIENISNPNNLIDTFIFNGDSNTTTYNLNYLRIGVDHQNRVFRSLLKFDLPKIPAGYRLVDAFLNLNAYAERLNYQVPILSAHKITCDWTESGAKWSNMNDKYDSQVIDYFNGFRGVFTGSSEAYYGGGGVNLTKVVKEWYENPSTNFGIMLKQYKEGSYNSECPPIDYTSKEVGNAKPTLSITYKNFNGLESYLSYTSQSHTFGSSHISNYTGNLTVTFDVANTVGGTLPANMNLVYNTLDVDLNKDFGYGLGIKPNLLQSINLTQLENNPLEYTDEDGTLHYFYKNKENIYHDEDGLGLTIELDSNNYLMKDKDSNVSKFVKHSNNIYYLEEIKDTNNKTIKVTYDSNNRITKVKDSANQEINITFSSNLITFTSPHKVTNVTLTNNLVTNINSLGTKEDIVYNSNKLIERIINNNGTILKFDYQSSISNRVVKVSEIGKNGTEGNYLTFNYDISDTSVTDRKGRVNTYIFNDYGNVVGITNLEGSNNLSNAYGKSYSFGNNTEDDEGNKSYSNVNKLTADKSLVRYLENLLKGSILERNEGFTFTSGVTKSYIVEDDGSNAVKFNISDFGAEIYNVLSGIEDDSETEYTISFYAKGNGTIDLRFGSSSNFTTDMINLTDEYQKITLSVKINRDVYTKSITLKIELGDTKELYVKDIRIEAGAVSNYYNILNDDFENWNIILDNAVGYEDLPIESTKEIYYDNYGQKILKLASTPISSAFVSQIIPIKGKAGDTFNLSFWYKNHGICPSGFIGMDGYGVWAHAAFIYENDDLDGTCIPAIELNTGSDEWQFFSENFTAAKDYSSVRIDVVNSQNVNDCLLTHFTLYKDLEQYSYEYDDNGNLVATTSLSKEKSTMEYNVNNQLTNALTPMGSNYSFEYDKNIKDRMIRATSPTGICNEVFYDSNNNPYKTRISYKKFKGVAMPEPDTYYIRHKGTNDYLYINDDKSLKVKACNCSHDKFNLMWVDDSAIKLQHATLTNYYIKIVDGKFCLSYGDYDNILKLITDFDNSFVIINSGGEALEVDSDNSIIKAPGGFDWDNVNQLFNFELADVNTEYMESIATYTPDGRFTTSLENSILNKTLFDIDTKTGLTNSTTDGLGNVTNYTYDDRLRLINISKGDQSVTYEYNDDNNLSKIKHGTKSYTFSYDEFNKTSSVKINDYTLVNNYYENNDGNLIKIKYGNNQEVNYTYDEFDRMKEIIKEDNTIHNYYDNLGRLVRVKSNSNEEKYEYDFAKRLSRYIGYGYVSDYDYGAGNLLVRKTDKVGMTNYIYDYEYNKENALSKLIIDNDNYNYSYDYLGRLSEVKLNNNLSTKYKYLSHGNRTSTLVNEVNDNGTLYSYEYNILGNVTKVLKNNEVILEYTYDMYEELLSTIDYEDKKKYIYTYDNLGNILNVKTYELDSDVLMSTNTYYYLNSNWEDQLTKFNDDIITYDEIGNPVSIGTKVLTWKNGRELATYTDDNLSISYNYNVNGIRTSKTVNGVTTKYALEGNKVLYESTNKTQIYYIYNGGDLLGFIYNGIKYYYHKNMFGDIIGIYDSSYKEIVKYKYDSYGKIISIIDNSTNKIGTINPFRYRSYYYDNETKLYYLNSRYYNPLWGRFINADVIINANKDILSGNLYQYVSNNFVNFDDKEGFWGIRLENIFKSVKKEKAKLKKKFENLSASASMFYKSFWFNENPELSEKEKELIVEGFLSNSTIKEKIDYSLKSYLDEGTFFIMKSFDPSKNDTSILKYGTGKFDYIISGRLIDDNVWMLTVMIKDVYDFDEYRSRKDGPSLGNYANDFAYTLTLMELVQAYSWNITYTEIRIM